MPAPDKNLNAEDQIEPTLSISGSKIGGTVSKNIFAEEKQKCLEVGGSTGSGFLIRFSFTKNFQKA